MKTPAVVMLAVMTLAAGLFAQSLRFSLRKRPVIEKRLRSFSRDDTEREAILKRGPFSRRVVVITFPNARSSTSNNRILSAYSQEIRKPLSLSVHTLIMRMKVKAWPTTGVERPCCRVCMKVFEARKGNTPIFS